MEIKAKLWNISILLARGRWFALIIFFFFSAVQSRDPALQYIAALRCSELLEGGGGGSEAAALWKSVCVRAGSWGVALLIRTDRALLQAG